MYDVLVKTSLAGSASGADSDLGFVEKISQILKDYRLGTDIRDIRRATGSDDAAEMMVAVQQQGGLASHFAWGASTKAPAHNSLFDFDERVLPLATKSLCAVVCTLCKEGCAKK